MAPNVDWARITFNLCRGCAFLTIGLVLAFLLKHWKDIGHRLLLLFGAGLFFDLAVTNFCNAIDSYIGGFALAPWTRATSALLSLLFAVHCVVSKDDMVSTLRTSEAEDRLRKDKAADREQARLQIAYLAIQTLEKSRELVQEREARRG